MDARSFDADKLLAETAWLRRLARGLVTSVADADDVVHDVTLAALEHRPATDRSLRGWLATVARNAIAAARRGSANRTARERRVAPGEAEPSSVDAVSRLELHARVLAAVRALDEPFRSVIVMRFFEELDTATIARRCGVPEPTVRTRIHRALARLRTRLEAAGGDGRPTTVSSLLAPLLPTGLVESKLALGLGVLAMKKSLVLVAGFVLFVGTGAWLLDGDDAAPVIESARRPNDVPDSLVVHAPPVVAAERVEVVAPPVLRSDAESAADETPISEDVVPEAVAIEHVPGRVVDVAGNGIADALVAFRGAVTKSGIDGVFEVPLIGFDFDLREQFAATNDLSRVSGRILATKLGYAPGVFDAPLAPGSMDPIFPPLVIVTLAPAAPTIRGKVIDDNGLPLAGTAVWIADPTFFGFDSQRQPILLESMLASGDISTENAVEPWQKVESDVDGSFEIPCIAARSYRVEAMDMRTMCHVAATDVAAGTRDLVLRLPTRRMLPLVAGRVVSLHGEPIEGARVRATRDAFRRPGGTWMESGATYETDAAGRFALNGVPAEGVYLRVDGAGIESVEFAHGASGIEAAASGRVTDLVITALREVAIEIELTRADGADEFEVLDREGMRLRIAYDDGAGSRRSSARWEFEGAHSGEFRVRESARTLVLYRAGQEVDRFVFDVVRDGVTRLRR